jgi:hypothetical protein
MVTLIAIRFANPIICLQMRRMRVGKQYIRGQAGIDVDDAVFELLYLLMQPRKNKKPEENYFLR